MKVNIAFETTDMDGEISKTSQFAVMERTKDGYRLVYVEDVLNNGNKIKATMLVTNDSLRVIRSPSRILRSKLILHMIWYLSDKSH